MLCRKRSVEMSEHNGCIWKKNIDNLETITEKKVLPDKNSMWYCSSQGAKEYFLWLLVQCIINACCSHVSESKREDIYMPSPSVKKF